MEYILSYVYNGEVYLPLMHFEDFKEACELLQIKGPVDNAVVMEVDAEMSVESAPKVMETVFQTEQCFLMEGDSDEYRNTSLEVTKQEMTDDMNGEGSDSNPFNGHEFTVKNDTEKRLFSKILATYMTCSINISPMIVKSIKNTELIFEDSKPIKAIHACGMCGIKIGIGCQHKGKSAFWNNYNFRRHILHTCIQKESHVTEEENINCQSESITAQNTESQSKFIDEGSILMEEEDEEMSDFNLASFITPLRRKVYLELTSQNDVDKYKKRLISTIRGVYQRQNIEITPHINKCMENSELVVEDDKLIKAIHVCGVCASKLSLGIQLKGTSSSWRSTNITRHLERICNKGITKENTKRRKQAEGVLA